MRLAYVPWIEALSTLLDSVADRKRDLRSGELNFVSQYPTRAAAVARLQEVTTRAIAGARDLPHGERHVVLAVGMIAMHVSDAGAWAPWAQPATRAVLRATDSARLPLLLLAAARVAAGWERARRYACGAVSATPSPIGQLTPVPPRPQ